MKCPHKNCGKEFEEPLELFTGELCCPHCKKSLSSNTVFKITIENDELYKLSEIYYLRYLSPKSWDQTGKDVMTLKPQELLDSAIKYCGLSAKLGHPMAVFRMGYYNEHYLETVRGERDRIKMAYNYYSSLCFCDKNNVSVETGAIQMSEDEFGFLKTRSAKALISLYENHPKVLKNSAKFNFENDRQRIKSLYGEDFVGRSDNGGDKKNRASNIFSILKSCLGKYRTPLCGLFLIKGSELKNLFLMKTNEKDKKPDLYKAISKGVEIRYLPCDENGIISSDRDERHFINFASEGKSKEILTEICDTDNLYLYFFNGACKRKYLSSRQIKVIEQALIDAHFEQVCRLIDFSAGDYLFFEDDFYYYAKGKNAKRSAELLVDKICGREE